MVGAGSHTIPTADTSRVDLADDTRLLIPLGSIYGTYKGTGGIMGGITMLAGSGKIDELVVWIVLAIVQTKYLQPGDGTKLVTVIVLIGNIVLLLTRYAAG